MSINSQGTDSGDNGDGINLTEDNKGSISITAGESINITAESEQADGIYVAEESSGDVTFIANGAGAEVGNIFKVENNGIDHRGTQNILLKAENGVNLISAKNGDGLRNEGSGTIKLDSTANEIISGDNGIQNSGSGSVIVNATNGNNNISGAADGINATGGEVTVTASDENKISGKVNGVFAQGEETKVTLTGGTNIIKVEDTKGSTIYGLQAKDDAGIDITSNSGAIELDLLTSGTHAFAVAAGSTERDNRTSGSVSLTSETDSILINVKTGAPDAPNGNVSGIQAQNQSNVTISAGKNIFITTNSSVVEQAPGAGANDVSNIRAQYGAEVIAEAYGYFKANSEDKNAKVVGFRSQDDSSVIKITSQGKDEFGYGISSTVSGKMADGILSQDGSTYLTSKNGGVYISASGKEATTAINSTASTVDVQVNIESEGDVFLSAQNSSQDYLNTNFVSGIFSSSYSGHSSNVNITGKDINIETESINNNIYGVYSYDSSSSLDNNVINISGTNVTITSSTDSAHSTYGVYSYYGTIDMSGISNNIEISAKSLTTSYGIYSYVGNVFLSSQNGFNKIVSSGDAIYNNCGTVSLISDSHDVNMQGNWLYAGDNRFAIYSLNSGIVNLQAYSNYLSGGEGIHAFDSKVTLNALSGDNNVQGKNYGIYALTWFSSLYNSNKLSLNAKNNLITATTGTGIFADSSKGLYSDGSGTSVELNADEDNFIPRR